MNDNEKNKQTYLSFLSFPHSSSIFVSMIYLYIFIYVCPYACYIILIFMYVNTEIIIKKNKINKNVILKSEGVKSVVITNRSKILKTGPIGVPEFLVKQGKEIACPH